MANGSFHKAEARLLASLESTISVTMSCRNSKATNVSPFHLPPLTLSQRGHRNEGEQAEGGQIGGLPVWYQWRVYSTSNL
jgi:hypothetical protein